MTSAGHAGTRSTEVDARCHRTRFLQAAVVHFTTDSAHLRSRARQTLRRVARLVTAQGFTHLKLVGNTDSRGSYRHNLALSRRRARAVHRYLHRVLDHARVHFEIRYVAYRDPVDTNATASGRAHNRRTTVLLR